MAWHRAKAIVYLHLLRTWRYKYSYLNSSLNTLLWITIFLLGALAFVPRSKLPETAPYVFWGLLLWNTISMMTWSVAGWMWFFISIGLAEDHMIHDTGIMSVVSGRLITVFMEVGAVAPLLYYVIMYSTGGAMAVHMILPLIYGFTMGAVMALSYSLILAALSLRTGVPGNLLDIANFLLLIVGGLIAPVRSLPWGMRLIALLVPYSHAAEIMRYGATGAEPYLGVWEEALLAGILALAMLTAAYLVFRVVENRYVRRYGVRAIGRM